MNPPPFLQTAHFSQCVDPEYTFRPGLGPLPGTAGTGTLGDPVQVHGEVRPSSRALKLPPQFL